MSAPPNNGLVCAHRNHAALAIYFVDLREGLPQERLGVEGRGWLSFQEVIDEVFIEGA